MEKDDEIKGEGNSYDFGARIYDPRIGRWLSTDPYEKLYVPISPYTFALNSPIKLIDEDGNIVTDEYGNPVTINVYENDDGSYCAVFDFVDGTSPEVARNFYNNGGRVIKTLVQVESGREIVDKADKSSDNIHIVISEDIRIETEEIEGGTKTKKTFGSTKYGFLRNKETRTAKRGMIVTIYEGTIKAVSNSNTDQSENKQFYLIDNLDDDQKVASTGSHELDHATDPDQTKRIKQNKRVTEEQHQKTRDFQKKVSGEFGEKNEKTK